jgi:hypothetical protein
MTDPEYQQFESRVVEWVAEWWGRGQLAPDSLINGRPIRADGDDAVELLLHLQARSGIAFGDEFEFQRYFGSEAILYDIWQRLRGRWPWRTRPITIRAVAEYLYSRRATPK